jgi:hypothetical protein
LVVDFWLHRPTAERILIENIERGETPRFFQFDVASVVNAEAEILRAKDRWAQLEMLTPPLA